MQMVKSDPGRDDGKLNVSWPPAWPCLKWFGNAWGQRHDEFEMV